MRRGGEPGGFAREGGAQCCIRCLIGRRGIERLEVQHRAERGWRNAQIAKPVARSGVLRRKEGDAVQHPACQRREPRPAAGRPRRHAPAQNDHRPRAEQHAVGPDLGFHREMRGHLPALEKAPYRPAKIEGGQLRRQSQLPRQVDPAGAVAGDDDREIGPGFCQGRDHRARRGQFAVRCRVQPEVWTAALRRSVAQPRPETRPVAPQDKAQALPKHEDQQERAIEPHRQQAFGTEFASDYGSEPGFCKQMTGLCRAARRSAGRFSTISETRAETLLESGSSLRGFMFRVSIEGGGDFGGWGNVLAVLSVKFRFFCS